MDEFTENEVKFNWEQYFKQLKKRVERLNGILQETNLGYRIVIQEVSESRVLFNNLIDIENYLYTKESELIDQLSEELGF